MKVLHLIDSLAMGGAQRILKCLLEFQPKDVDLHAAALRSVPHPIEIEHPNIHVHRSSRRLSLGPLRELRQYVLNHSIDVLHCHLFRSQVFGFLLKAMYFPQLLLVFHEHGRVVGREHESALEDLIFRRFLKLAAPRVDCFVCISPYTRDALSHCLRNVPARTVVVHNPLADARPGEFKRSREEARRKLGVPKGAFTVGFAGRLVRRKGWEHFLDAIQVAASRNESLFFLVAGDGPERSLVERHIGRLQIQARGRLLGQLNNMREFYDSLDCFVMPSLWEPHGLAHLEAQRAAVPVVVADVPGLRDTVHDGMDAILYRAGNVKELAAVLGYLMREPVIRSALAREGVKNAARYSVEEFASALTRVYQSISSGTADMDIRT